MSPRPAPPAARPARDRLAAALGHLQRGEIAVGAALLDAILKDSPRDPAALGLAGAVALQRGDRGTAIAHLTAALKAAPSDVSAHSNIALAYTAEGRLDDAQRHLELALKLKPASPEALVNLGNIHRRRQDYGQAEPLYRKAAALQPSLPQAHANLADVLEHQGRPAEALSAIRRALELNPRFAEAHGTHGRILDALGRLDESLAAHRTAIELRPRDPRAHADLGKTLMAYGRRDEAIASYEAASGLNPGNAGYLRMLGKLNAELGTLEEKAARFASPTTRPEEKLQLGFALGKAHEDAGDYAGGFPYLLEANRLKRATYDYDPKSSETAFAELRAAFTPELFAAHANAGHPDTTPIFVLGMPRSGTTLVEQILASHPEVYGAGELPLLRDLVTDVSPVRPVHFPTLLPKLVDADFTRLGAAYAKRLRGYSDSARFITDKMPGNFMLIGFIRLALPNARIVHCVRDPADTAVSIFRNFFSSRLSYAYDLAEIGHYHRLYQQLMQHWHRVIPGHVYDISYEALVADQEGETRRLLEHCGLAFDPAVLAFHRTERPVHTASAAQVRSPISKGSIGIADRYGELLAPLRRALAGEA